MINKKKLMKCCISILCLNLYIDMSHAVWIPFKDFFSSKKEAIQPEEFSQETVVRTSNDDENHANNSEENLQERAISNQSTDHQDDTQSVAQSSNEQQDKGTVKVEDGNKIKKINNIVVSSQCILYGNSSSLRMNLQTYQSNSLLLRYAMVAGYLDYDSQNCDENVWVSSPPSNMLNFVNNRFVVTPYLSYSNKNKLYIKLNYRDGCRLFHGDDSNSGDESNPILITVDLPSEFNIDSNSLQSLLSNVFMNNDFIGFSANNLLNLEMMENNGNIPFWNTNFRSFRITDSSLDLIARLSIGYAARTLHSDFQLNNLIANSHNDNYSEVTFTVAAFNSFSGILPSDAYLLLDIDPSLHRNEGSLATGHSLRHLSRIEGSFTVQDFTDDMTPPQEREGSMTTSLVNHANGNSDINSTKNIDDESNDMTPPQEREGSMTTSLVNHANGNSDINSTQNIEDESNDMTPPQEREGSMTTSLVNHANGNSHINSSMQNIDDAVNGIMPPPPVVLYYNAQGATVGISSTK